jgi:multiple sugar transport system substrate-binding protein
MNRTRSGAALAALMTLALTACGVGGGDTTSKDGPSKVAGCDIPAANQKSGPLSGPVTGEITFETLGLKGAFEKFFTAQIQRFEAKHPGVKVNWIDDPGGAEYVTRLTTNVKVCKLADVINADVQGVQAMSTVGLIMDMGDRLPNAGKNYTKEMWAAAVPPGVTQHAALPWYTGYPALLYNKDLVAQSGVTVPLKTYDDYFAALKAISSKAAGKFYGDWGSPQYLLPDAWAHQKVQFMDGDHTKFTFASDPTALKWLTSLADAYQAGAFPKDSISGDPNASEAFAAGKLAMGGARTRTVKKNGPDVYAKTGVMPYPYDKLGGPLINGQYITVPKTSKNAAAALAFAEFVTSVPEQEAWCSTNGVSPIPPMANLPDSSTCWTDSSYDAVEKEYMDVQRQSVSKAKYDPIIWYWTGAVSQAVVPHLQLAMQGKKSPQEALTAAEDAANKILRKAGSN